MDGFKGQGQLDHVTSRALSVDEKQAGVVSAAAKTVCTVFFSPHCSSDRIGCVIVVIAKQVNVLDGRLKVALSRLTAPSRDESPFRVGDAISRRSRVG
ncbi:hypothetical protein MTP99_011954 [Tenebrio molitor]|jgi:hypothetical protein|nr:hypothetical protein MTP99_011954 [Tenebrio molitor]